MGNISDKLQYLAETKEAIKEALVAKGIPITNRDTFRSYANTIKGEYPDVLLWGIDGKLLYAFTKEEFLSLEALPVLENGHWNYYIEEAKAIVEEYGFLDIGAVLLASNSQSARMSIAVTDEQSKYLELVVSTGFTTYTIDWGDGSTEELPKSDTHPSHTYHSNGEYIVEVSGLYNSNIFVGKNHSIKEIICCLNHITLEKADRLELVNAYGGVDAHDCPSVRVIICDNDYSSAHVSNTPSLRVLSSPFFEIGGLADDWERHCVCTGLKRVVTQSYGGYIAKAGIAMHPDLTHLAIKNNISSVSERAFAGCYSLKRIELPNLASIAARAFEGCISLEEFTIPNGVKVLQDKTFSMCVSLRKVVFPSALDTLKFGVFEFCYNLEVLDFSASASVPTIQSDTFAYDSGAAISSYCKIIVPDSLYDEWIAASYWSNYASQIIKASEYNG